MTRELRRSPWWASFRDELSRRGLTPGEVVLVDGFDDDEDIDVGLLYTEEKRLIAWRRMYFDDDPSQDRILEWEDITDRLGRNPLVGPRWCFSPSARTHPDDRSRVIEQPHHLCGQFGALRPRVTMTAYAPLDDDVDGRVDAGTG